MNSYHPLLRDEQEWYLANASVTPTIEKLFFTAIVEQQLNWTQNNQDTLRVYLYHNLCDVVISGDTSAAGLGKRIVFLKDRTKTSIHLVSYEGTWRSISLKPL
ncbi:hypothetical protein Tco_1000079, partial [Tanacetum coccineum]